MATIARPESFSLPLSAPRYRCRKASHTSLKVRQCLRKTILFLLSSVGITVIVVAYCIIGGLVFVALEAPNEEIVKNKASTIREKYLNDLYDVFDKMNIFHQENWTTGADMVLAQFQNDIYNLVTKEGWSGDETIGGDPKWTFAGSLLFSVTVITTIGYGTVTPKTVAGQAVTIVYALIGIPLTFVCLSNIGRLMASCFRTLYGKNMCVFCRRKWRLLLGRKHTRLVPEKIELNETRNYSDANDSTEKDCEVVHEAVEIPFSTCLYLMGWYIVFGAIMFSIWEKEWDLFTGSYFCFITLSTIGFGDIVPGLTHEDWNDQVKQVACSLYLLIGLATIAMCFELMQEKAQRVATRCATFIGLLSENEEEEL